MAKKKASKKVLDYDPLAWLDEDPTSPSKSAQSEKKVPETENPGYGFFSDDGNAEEAVIAETPVVSQQPLEKDPVTEEDAYGFFDDSLAGEFTKSAQSDESGKTIDLGTELTIRSVASCKAQIDDNLLQGQEIKLQAENLQKIDSAGLQMLYSLDKTLKKTSQSIHWVNSSAIINEAARMIGLEDLIAIDIDEAGFGFFNDEPAVKSAQQEESGFGFF